MKDRFFTKRAIWRIVTVIIALLFFGTLIIQCLATKQIPVTPNCEGVEIDIFRTQLALMPSSEVKKRESVKEKIKTWETMVAVCENVTPATRLPGETPQFMQATPYPYLQGIFEGQPGAYFHAFEAKIENHWKGVINGNRVIVFAGAWVKDPDQGFLAVQTAPSKGKPVWNFIPSATKAGALRIVEVKGSRLIIQQENNKHLLFFDVPTLSFINSLDEVVTTSPPTQILNTVQPSLTTNPYPIP